MTKIKEKIEKEETMMEFKIKFRKSKLWKEKREQLINEKGGKCEWCDSIDFLTPAHKDVSQLIKFVNGNDKLLVSCTIINSVLQTNYYRIFNAYLQQCLIDKLPENYFETIFVCKNCGVNLKKVKTEPEKLKGDVWKKLYEDNKTNPLLMEIVKFMEEKFMDYYKNFDNCLLLCKKCHFAQGKGMLLCEKCKKKYYNPIQYEECYNCNPNKDLIEARTKIREIQDKIDDFERFEDFEICCKCCGKEMYDEINEEGTQEFDKFGHPLSLYCSKCKLLPNKNELSKKRYIERNKKKKELEEQQRELIKLFPLGKGLGIGYINGYNSPTEDKELNEWKKKGTNRNKPCPCGSGIKFKKCCWDKTNESKDK